MAEQHDIPPASRPPKRPRVDLVDLKYLVRVPGRPELVQSYTEEELSEAQAYAGRVGGVLDELPLT